MRLRKVCFDKLRTGLLALLLGAKGIATRSKDAANGARFVSLCNFLT